MKQYPERRPRALAVLGCLLCCLGLSLAAWGTVCGPDAYGYTWRDWADGASFETIPFVNPTAVVPPAPGEPPVRVPFPFGFYGRLYADLYISPEGWVSFVDPGNVSQIPACEPEPLAPNAFIAPFMPSGPFSVVADTLQYEYFASRGVFKVYWNMRITVAGSGSFRFELLLFDDGRIKFQYLGYTGDASRLDWFLIAIENETGTTGLQAQCGTTDYCGFDLGAFAGQVLEFLPPLSCSITTPLQCGQTLTRPAPPPALPNVSVYGCGNEGYAGNERMLRFTLTETSSVSAWLSNFGGRALDLFILGSCNQWDCLVQGDGSIDASLLGAGTYYLVVDGPTATDTSGSFDITLSCEEVSTPVSCGETVAGDTSGQTNKLDNLACAPRPLDGPDQIFHLDLPFAASPQVRLDASANLDVTILSDLTPAVCLQWGDSWTRLWNAPAGSYYVVVDGDAGESGPFELELSCQPEMDCSIAPPTLGCGDAIGDDTTRGTNLVNGYACRPETHYSGPELSYRIDNPLRKAVFASLREAQPELDSLLLRDCDEGTCLVESCWDGFPVDEYYVTVDGRDGASGPFDLEVICFDPTQFDRWYLCEGTDNFSEQPPDDSVTARYEWEYNTADNYCPDDCDFAMYTVVECGQEFHLPFWDVESGHIRIFDMLRNRYVEMEAENDLLPSDPSYVFMTGTDIQWISNGCPANGSSDPRYNLRTMDIRFFGTPSVCGVYRIELLGWGGYNWDLFANCSGLDEAGFLIYSNACEAMAAWNALPQLELEEVAVTDLSDCPQSASIEATLVNTGCRAAVDIPVTVTFSTGDPPNFFVIPSVPAESRMTLAYDLGPFSAVPVIATLILDPGDPGSIYECSEAGSNPITCSPPPGVAHERTVELCPDSCATNADSGEPGLTICVGESVRLDGSGSTIVGCLGEIEYRWEVVGNPGQFRDWGSDPTWDVTPLLDTLYALRTRCSSQPACTSEDLKQVAVYPVPVPDAGEDDTVCEDDVLTLVGEAASVSPCDELEYRWLDGAVVLRDWGADPSLDLVASSSTVLTLEVRCADNPDCLAADSLQLTVEDCQLAVSYASYQARHEEGGVRVSWSTTTESGTFGFQLSARDGDGESHKLPSLVPARGSDSRYEYLDDSEAARSGRLHEYRIVEITTDGEGDATPWFQVSEEQPLRGQRQRGRDASGRRR